MCNERDVQLISQKSCIPLKAVYLFFHANVSYKIRTNDK